MHTWSEAETAAPQLAADVRARFEATGLGFLATLRRDGWPRISGIEPLFFDGELWLGMMPGSRKAADLRRDPRFALHAASTDTQVTEGDAKLGGRAVEVTEAAEHARYARAFKDHTGSEPGEGPFYLFRAEVLELSLLKPAGDHLDIAWWRAGGPVQQVERR